MGVAQEVGELLFEYLMAQRSVFHAIAAESGLSPPQVGALWHLSVDAPMPMSALAGAMACDPSNVTGIVDKLEGRAMLKREASSSDRRVKMLRLTKKGNELRGRVVERMNEPPPWLKQLTASEQKQLRDLLRKGLGR